MPPTTSGQSSRDNDVPEYRSTLVFADPEDGNQLKGIEAVDSADVLLVSEVFAAVQDEDAG